MATVHDVIGALRKVGSNAERGAKFERLMVRYFPLDPLLHDRYDQVWRWADWPGHQGGDIEIDLVARGRDSGDFTAIQCKFYEPTHALAKGDIDSFFIASGKKPFANRIIISTTDRWGSNAEATLADQHIPVQRISLAHIAGRRTGHCQIYYRDDGARSPIIPRSSTTTTSLFPVSLIKRIGTCSVRAPDWTG